MEIGYFLRCKNCNHLGYHEYNSNECYAYNSCKCNKFSPFDNLEYLEYLYEKRLALQV
jgi:hypothetical protein